MSYRVYSNSSPLVSVSVSDSYSLLRPNFRSISFCLTPESVSFCFYSCALGFVSGGSLLIGCSFPPPNSSSDPRAGDSVPRRFTVHCSAESQQWLSYAFDIRRARPMVGELLPRSFCWTSGLRPSGLYMNRHRMHFWVIAIRAYSPEATTRNTSEGRDIDLRGDEWSAQAGERKKLKFSDVNVDRGWCSNLMLRSGKVGWQNCCWVGLIWPVVKLDILLRLAKVG